MGVLGGSLTWIGGREIWAAARRGSSIEGTCKALCASWASCSVTSLAWAIRGLGFGAKLGIRFAAVAVLIPLD